MRSPKYSSYARVERFLDEAEMAAVEPQPTPTRMIRLNGELMEVQEQTPEKVPIDERDTISEVDENEWGELQPWQKIIHPAELLYDDNNRLVSSTDDKTPKPIECVMEAGDTIVVPSGWWHAVVNLEHSVAITENWAHEHNIKEVRSEISKRPQFTAVDGALTKPHRCLQLLTRQHAAAQQQQSKHEQCGNPDEDEL